MDNTNLLPVRVGIIAPSLFSWGLERLIQGAHPHLELVTTWPTVTAALALAPPVACDVIVMDLGTDECLDTISRFHAATPASLLLVTGSADLAFLDNAIVSGARGVVQKAEPPDTLLKAIDRVSRGEYWINRAAIGRIFIELARRNAPQPSEPAGDRIATLTLRERKTILALTRDASAPGKILASRLCISEHTLRNHLTSIYQKLGLVNRLDLYAFAMRNGIVDQGEAGGDRPGIAMQHHGAARY